MDIPNNTCPPGPLRRSQDEGWDVVAHGARPHWLAGSPMDWKPPDFFLCWARTICRVSSSTSEAHSELGKVGRARLGPG